MIRDISAFVAWLAIGVSVAILSHPAWGVLVCSIIVIVVCLLGMLEQYRMRHK